MAASDDVEHYRMRAAEMRGRAERAELPSAKAGLQRIAEDFELLAARAEGRLAGTTKPAGTQSPTPGTGESTETPASGPKPDPAAA